MLPCEQLFWVCLPGFFCCFQVGRWGKGIRRKPPESFQFYQCSPCSHRMHLIIQQNVFFRSVKSSGIITIPRSNKQSQKNESLRVSSGSTKEFSNKWYCENSTVLTLRHGWAVFFFIHLMHIMFTASKFVSVTLFLEGVWLRSTVKGGPQKSVNYYTNSGSKVPLRPSKSKTQLIFKIYFINL